MKTLNKKPLYLAVAGFTALGAVGAAQAVNVAPNGLGQVLVYPYYTVKGPTATPFNTLISIVNSTGSTKAVKVRFREGKASKEVLDFNLFLSPNDMWVAGLQASGTGGVLLTTPDKSCTIPPIPAAGVEFKNGDYAGDAVDDPSLARLQEGYIEVFEMATYTDASTTATNSRHTAGVPKDCTKVTNSTADSEQRPPQGGLSGTASLVAPGSGFNSATDAIALANFKQAPLYATTGSIQPDFSDADQWSTTIADDGDVVWSSWSYGEDAVSGALMKDSIVNEYVLDAATASATDWVVTFPTKHHYVFEDTVFDPFERVLSTKGSCDDVGVSVFNREEGNIQTLDFSPATSSQLCWEANIVTFNGRNIFNSTNTLSVSASPFEHGWAEIGFTGSFGLVANSSTFVSFDSGGTFVSSGGGAEYSGLPAIGFAVQIFRVSSTQAYAGTFYHRYRSGI